MTYRIDSLKAEYQAEVMVAPDSFQMICDRIEQMVTAGRGMILVLREFTYLNRPPEVYGGLQLATEDHNGGFLARPSEDVLLCQVMLEYGMGDYHDRVGFGFSERSYRYSGNETELAAWQRYRTSPDGGEDRLRRRRNMTHVEFTGGLPGWRKKRSDRIVITRWNDDGVATEATLGFAPSGGSW